MSSQTRPGPRWRAATFRSWSDSYLAHRATIANVERNGIMHETVVGAPWLERESPEGCVEKTILATLPFRIGRHDSADLHIDSSQVSREHAVITRHGKKFQVKDLGSTNGTFLNGEQIEEAIRVHERLSGDALTRRARELLELVRILKQCVHTIADKTHRSLVTGDQEQQGESQEFALRQSIPVHLRNDICGGGRPKATRKRTAGGRGKAKLQGLGAASSIFKYYGTELNKRRNELNLAVGGESALGWDGPAYRDGATSRDWLRSKGNSIEGGTDEIQCNVIGEQVLGLPGDVRVDKHVPWREVPRS